MKVFHPFQAAFLWGYSSEGLDLDCSHKGTAVQSPWPADAFRHVHDLRIRVVS